MQALIILNIKMLLGNCQWVKVGLKSIRSSISLRLSYSFFFCFKSFFFLASFYFLAANLMDDGLASFAGRLFLFTGLPGLSDHGSTQQMSMKSLINAPLSCSYESYSLKNSSSSSLENLDASIVAFVKKSAFLDSINYFLSHWWIFVINTLISSSRSS